VASRALKRFHLFKAEGTPHPSDGNGESASKLFSPPKSLLGRRLEPPQEVVQKGSAVAIPSDSSTLILTLQFQLVVFPDAFESVFPPFFCSLPVFFPPPFGEPDRTQNYTQSSNTGSFSLAWLSRLQLQTFIPCTSNLKPLFLPQFLRVFFACWYV